MDSDLSYSTNLDGVKDAESTRSSASPRSCPESLREGFGLVVAERSGKESACGGKVGGIVIPNRGRLSGIPGRVQIEDVRGAGSRSRLHRDHALRKRKAQAAASTSQQLPSLATLATADLVTTLAKVSYAG